MLNIPYQIDNVLARHRNHELRLTNQIIMDLLAGHAVNDDEFIDNVIFPHTAVLLVAVR
jgi:hypothetical protein